MKSVSHFFAASPLQSKRLAIRGLGVLETVASGVVNRPRGSGDYLLCYFYDPVWIAASRLPHPYPSGTFMIFSPGRWQYFGKREVPFRYSYLHADGEVFRNLLQEHRLPVDEPTPVDVHHPIEQALALIHEELTTSAQPGIMVIRNLLDTMARKIMQRVQPADGECRIPECFLAVRRRIEVECARKLSLAELAAQTGHSADHFNELFHRYFGLPAYEYLLRQRLGRAEYLLRDRSMSVAAVARAVGYAGTNTFNQLFKRQFGQTPTALRGQEPETAAT